MVALYKPIASKSMIMGAAVIDTCFRRLKAASMIAETKEGRTFAEAQGSRALEINAWQAYKR